MSSVSGECPTAPSTPKPPAAGDRGDHVSAVAEGEERELAAEHVADGRFHILPCWQRIARSIRLFCNHCRQRLRRRATNHGKTLVFCFDGTGNEPSDVGGFQEDESITNVLKLHILMGGGLEGHAPAKTPGGNPQRSFYYNGIGTLEVGRRIPLLGRLYSAGRSKLNMAFAPTWADARRILDEARADFEQANYQPGDTLALFGYSRGAALARKFASLILDEHEQCRVSFLGVFDTVAAMNGIYRTGDKLSSDVVFENGTLNPRIEHAVHLLAIDEDRVAFSPTLINKDAAHPERINEVWLPGVHGDVGGGYWRDGLSDNALALMIEECRTTLGRDIFIGQESDIARLLGTQQGALADIQLDDVAIYPLIHGTLHAHTDATATLMSREVRSIHVNRDDERSLDASDLPLLHHSVAVRFAAVPDYRPAALRGIAYRLLLASGRAGGEMRGIAGLRAHRQSIGAHL